MVEKQTRLSSRESAARSVHQQDSTCLSLTMSKSDIVRVEIFCGWGGVVTQTMSELIFSVVGRGNLDNV